MNRKLVLLLTLGLLSISVTAQKSSSQRRTANRRPLTVREQQTPPPKIDEGYVMTGDGIRLFYQKAGRGNHTVIIPNRLFMFDEFIQLADRYTLISYDMRNRGRSDAVSDGKKITIHHDVKDLEKVRQHFGVKKFSVIGYSYLGLMVVMYAMEHPEFIERIIQLGPVPLKFDTQYPAHLTANDQTPIIDPSEVEKINKLRQAGYDKSNPKDFCEKQWALWRVALVGNPANAPKVAKGICEMPNEWLINFERHLQYHFVESIQHLNIPKEDVAKVTHPTLTIHGTKDRNAPYGAGREWASILPNARLLTVKGAAHHVFVDAPEVVFPAIRVFLSGKWPKEAERVTGKDTNK